MPFGRLVGYWSWNPLPGFLGASERKWVGGGAASFHRLGSIYAVVAAASSCGRLIAVEICLLGKTFFFLVWAHRPP